ncbi:MAG: hypothetical protein M3P27_00975 [Acidobacteriota bacterium]|nr:hypothetical protein [Acidobacteriota bacterium]
MYTGNMIDNLIASVQQAEEHAGLAFDNQMPVQVEVRATHAYQFANDNEAVFGVA